MATPTGENHFNAANLPAEVFDEDGNVHKTNRPNARELVATGKFFWKAEDVGKSPDEQEDGPADPSAAEVTVYAKNGTEFSVSMANAREMVASGDYSWAPAHADTASEETGEANGEDAGEETATASTEEAADAAPAATDEPKAEDPLDPLNTPLHEIAKRVTGNADVAKYLEGFTEDQLREMAAQRYGAKMHHRSSKETIIAKMVELEEAKLDAEDAGDSEEA